MRIGSTVATSKELSQNVIVAIMENSETLVGLVGIMDET
jgi:hypothetical protein